jgi:hypothetical protein
MAYKVIPQVEFDKAVQRILSLDIGRITAENLVISFWKITQDLNIDFKKFLDNATSNGKLDVSQEVLDYINKTLPNTIRYRKQVIQNITPVATREL